MKMSLDETAIKSISLFHKMTGSSVVDMIDSEDMLYFVVKEGEYGLAVGKGGTKVRAVEDKFKKTVKVFEYSGEMEKFIRNMVPEIHDLSITDNGIFVRVRSNARARVIGKSGKNIKIVNEFLKRHFDRDDLKVK